VAEIDVAIAIKARGVAILKPFLIVPFIIPGKIMTNRITIVITENRHHHHHHAPTITITSAVVLAAVSVPFMSY